MLTHMHAQCSFLVVTNRELFGGKLNLSVLLQSKS